MYRRDFLKLGGLFSALFFLQLGPLGKIPSVFNQVEAHGCIFRGTAEGQIYVSEDQGKTWRLHTRFDPELSITQLTVDSQERVVASLEYRGHDFRLSLSNPKDNWKTV